MARIANQRVALLLAMFSLVGAAGWAEAQALVDPGFESYAVDSGGFVQPESGPWTFANDAGVVEPFSPNSSGGPLNTWSATFDAFDGEQYASTYAIDSIRQPVTFDAAGRYRISAYAAAPSGSLTIPGIGTLDLEDGEFTFVLNSDSIGSVHTVPAGSDWSQFRAEFEVAAPGELLLGVRNSKQGSYFVNFDAFELQQVPEPTAVQLGVILGVGLVVRREVHRRRS